MPGLRPAHFNGTATTTITQVDFNKTAMDFAITNLDDTNNLLISFDGGRKSFVVLPETTFHAKIFAHSMHVSSNAGTADYTCLAMG